MSTTESQAPAYVLPSIIQVLVPGPVLDKKYQDREYKAQQLECLALDDAGQPLQVGIIRVPSHLHGQISAGFYRPVFGMRVDRDRVIQPVLLDLTPYKPAPASGTSAPSKSAAATAATA
ncbi:hypothetical protein [Comamonas sp.]|uniref:hypothetical protein n=1 Tax=Comamonas sp. TaxID=34028 RepID=UPI00258D4964|nr:hypothetical protein [Comamonas sp.]